MAEIIEMPLMSDTMVEGVIVAWHKKVGDSVKTGELLAEVETDKATMDLESFYGGVLLYVAADAGGAVKVGDLLAIIGKEGEDVTAIVNQYKSKTSAVAEPKPEPAPVSAPTPEPVAVASPPVSVAPTPTASADDGRVKASPLAKSIANQSGIPLTAISGSGDGGRIVKRDVEAFLASPQPVAMPTAPAKAVYQPAIGESYEDVPLSQMRKTIARRLSESKFTAPHYYLTMEINMNKTMKLRAKLNEVSDVKISVNDFIIKAVALALRKNPKVNASWTGETIRIFHHINIGMAVAIEDGLIVPVIRHADAKGLSDIAYEAKDLAARAKARDLQPAEFQGNTFTVSNLGMFGIDQFTAIINPPDSCILAVGGINEVPRFVEKDGKKKVKPAQIMKVTMSCDHRVVDGALGSAFLGTLRDLLEQPDRMLL
jgi:pyruvate dehydrogenase E2 component (dihydrolipoamide acetyltransferase)